MARGPLVTMADLLLYIRQKVLDARKDHDQDALLVLSNMLEVIQDVAWSVQDTRLASLVEDLLCAIRDSLTGVEWKSTIPSPEAIEQINHISS
jgi:hypothetical protein